MIHTTWKNNSYLVKEVYQTNIFIAAFTTCWARLKLYDVLHMLDTRVLYFDTDSVIFVRPGDVELEIGPYLGHLDMVAPDTIQVVGDRNGKIDSFSHQSILPPLKTRTQMIISLFYKTIFF